MSWDFLERPTQPEEQPWEYSDLPKSAVAGAGAIESGLAGLAKHYLPISEKGQEFFRQVQQQGENVQETGEEWMTPQGRRLLGAAVTSEDFLSHPFASVLLKTANMTPSMAASVLPGGVIGGVAGRLGSLAATVGAGSALGAADVQQSIESEITQASDADLRKESPGLYGKMRDEGASEQSAKEALAKEVMGMKPLVGALLGAVSGAWGPGANIAKRIAAREAEGAVGGIERKGLGEALTEAHGWKSAAIEGLTTETAEEGYNAVAQQQAEMERGARKDYDLSAIIGQALTGGMMGGLLGGVSGIGGGHVKEAGKGRAEEEVYGPPEMHGPRKPPETYGPPEMQGPRKPRTDSGVEVVPPLTPNAAETASLQTQQQAAPAKTSNEQAIPPTPPTPPAQPPPGPAQTVSPAPAAQTTQQQQAPPEPPQAPAAPSPAAPVQQPAPAPAPVQQEQPAPVTPEVTPSQQVVEPPGAPAVEPPAQQPVSPPGAAPAAQEAAAPPVAEPPTNKGGGRILRTVGQEEQAQALPGAEAIKQQEKALKKQEREVSTKNWTAAEKKANAERNTYAEQKFKQHAVGTEEAPPVRLDVPDKLPPARAKEMAAKLKSMVDDVLGGIELRENLPDHIRHHFSPPKGRKGAEFKVTDEEKARHRRSLPERIDKNQDPHLAYLRELVDVHGILENAKDLGPKSKKFARVLRFIASHNEAAPDLVKMGRQEASQELSASMRGATAEQGEAQQARRGAGEATEGAVGQAESTGAASAVRGVSEQVKAELEAKYGGKPAEKPAAPPAPAPPAEGKGKAKAKEIQAKQAPAAPPPPKVGPKGEAIKAKAEPKGEEAVTLPGRKPLPMVKTEGLEANLIPAAKRSNEVRTLINSLPDEAYAALDPAVVRRLGEARTLVAVNDVAEHVRQRVGEKPVAPPAPKANPVQELKVRNSEKEAEHAETGKPITVNAFHGTTTVFERFMNKFIGSNYVSGLGAHWFTASSEAANSYAVRLEQSQHDWNAGKVPEPKGTPNIHMVKVDLKNPLVVDMEGQKYDPIKWNKELNKGREGGHDGVILKNAVDGGGVQTTVYAVFDEKSVRGRFEEPSAEVVEATQPETKIEAKEEVKPAEEAKPEPAAAAEEEVTPKVTEEKPRPKFWEQTDEELKGLHPIAREKNILRRWVNSLSDEDYRKLEKAEVYDFPRSLADTMEPDRLLAAWQRTLAEGKPVMVDPGDYTHIINATENDLNEKGRRTQARTTQAASAAEAAAYTPQVTSKPVTVALKKRRGPKLAKLEDFEGDGPLDPNWEQDLQNVAEAHETPPISAEDILKHFQQDENPMALQDDEHDLYATPLHKAQAIYGHDSDSLSEGVPAADVLRDLDLSHLSGLPRYLADFVRRQLVKYMPKDLKLYIADAALIDDSLPYSHKDSQPGGLYNGNAGAHGSSYIAIDSKVARSKQQFAHVVIHEAMHAALERAIESDAHFAARLETLRGYMKLKFENTEHWNEAWYAASDIHEFVSEVMSRPGLQELMAQTEFPAKLAKAFGLKGMHPRSLWGSFVETVSNKIRGILGLSQSEKLDNFLDISLRVIAPEMEKVRIATGPQGVGPRPIRMLSREALAQEARTRAADALVNKKGALARAKDKISNAWQISRRALPLFGRDTTTNPAHQVFDLRTKMEAAKNFILNKYKGLEASAKIALAERSHPELMQRAKEIWLDASRHDINLTGTNEHLGKDVMIHTQGRAQVARLQKEWADPKFNPIRKTMEDAGRFFKNIHNAVSEQTIDNLLDEAGVTDPTLRQRVHNDTLDEADLESMDSNLVKKLNQIRPLKRKHGSYIPFRRYGDFISAGEHELTVPKNGLAVGERGNVIQFVDPIPKNGEYSNVRARKQAKRYMIQESHTPQGNQLQPLHVQKVFVDRNNQSQIVEKEDPNAIPAYRVTMQNEHVEMHETEAQARNNEAALREAGLKNTRTNKREEAYQGTRSGVLQESMGAVLRSLEKQQRYKDADKDQQKAMREMFHDLTLGMSGTTSIKNSMRYRRNVAGMSRDLGKVTGDYARMTANHLAMLQYRPQLDKQFARMRDYMKAHSDKDNIRRREIYEELKNRIYGDASRAAEEHKPGIISRMLQVSRLHLLAGPSFHIVNAHEPWMVSLPVIGGRHGFVKTGRKMLEMYNLIGGRQALTSGFKDTVKAYTNDHGFTDYPKVFKEEIRKNKFMSEAKKQRMIDAIDYMNDRNLFGNSAIFEVGKYADPSGNIGLRALDRADLMANQVGTAIEAINRAVTGLAAYDLEHEKNGGNHEAAQHYAYATTNDTMGDYSSWNAAPMFNTKAGRIFGQFKKYPQKMYYLLGNVMGGALRGDREAMKQFAGLMVTHGAIAGALGLPTEPMKLALIAANMAGVTGFTPDDYEYAVRQLAARIAGQTGGEILSKGLYRGIGIEASGRFGLGDLMTRGAPKSQKDQDLKSWLFDTMAGAPAGTLIDWKNGVQAAFKGDIPTFLEKASPIRSIGDIAKAGVGLAGPKKGTSGTTQQEQFTPYQAAVRAFGFQPSGVAEQGAMRGTVARESRQMGEERAAVIRAWTGASGAGKVSAQRAVQDWNRSHGPDEQISSSDLTSAASRAERQTKAEQHGVVVGKRNKDIYERASSVFNP